MTTHAPSTRRDPRYELRRGTASIEFDDPASPGARLSQPLTRISVAGLAFETSDAGPTLPEGTLLETVTIQVSGCQLQGEALVRSSWPADDGTLEVGCLFYPQTSELEERLMTLVAGIEAAQLD